MEITIDNVDIISYITNNTNNKTRSFTMETVNANKINHLTVENNNNIHYMIDVSVDDPYPFEPDDDYLYDRVLERVIDVITTTVDYPDDVSTIVIKANGRVIDTYDIPAYPDPDTDHNDMIEDITAMVVNVVRAAGTSREGTEND